MNRILFILFLLGGGICLQAKDYTLQEIPMVHLVDRMRYVSNPDTILADSIVTRMDSLLYALEEKTGIQTLVVAVSGIEGGDCFDFAHRTTTFCGWCYFKPHLQMGKWRPREVQ